MPWSLKRYYGTHALHFITWSCRERKPILGTPGRRDLLLTVVEQMRLRYQFVVVGYVIMPEHLHLLISEPERTNPSTVIQAIKLSFVRRIRSTAGVGFLASVAKNRVEGCAAKTSGQTWMKRFYDFNVWSQRKEVEKIHYMHQNPVARGLVQRPEDWAWSSFRAYGCGEDGAVRINDWSLWEERIRGKIS